MFAILAILFIGSCSVVLFKVVFPSFPAAPRSGQVAKRGNFSYKETSAGPFLLLLILLHIMCNFFIIFLRIMKTIALSQLFRLLPASALVLVASCSGSHSAHEEHAEDAHKDAHANEVVMSEQAFDAAGIRFETVAPGDFREAVKASGVIENAQGAVRVISAPATGIVSFASGVVQGSAVRAGQALFSISSKGLEQNDANATLHVDLSIAEKELRRAEELVKEDLISRREYERIVSDYERAKAAASTVTARTGSATAVASPIGGYVTSLDVSPGSFVNMGDQMAVVASNQRILLRADLSERHRAFAASIAGANILPAGAEKAIVLADYGARVLSAGSAPTQGSHYFPVYIEFNNPGSLGNGSVVEAWLLGPARKDVISVPKSALVEEGGFFYVYVLESDLDEHEGHDHEANHDGHKGHDHEAEDNHDDHKDHDHEAEAGHDEHGHEHGSVVFRKVEVKIGATDGARVEILSGLSAGDKVAVEGALKIRMAGMGSSIQGHSHHH